MSFKIRFFIFIQSILKKFESVDAKLYSIIIFLIFLFLHYLTHSSFPFLSSTNNRSVDFQFDTLFEEYENPYLFQTEEDLKYIDDPGYGKQLPITKKIVSEHQIDYQIKYEPFTLEAPHFIDEESFDLFIKLEKPRYNQVIDKKTRKAYFNYTDIMYGNLTVVQNRKFRDVPICRPNTTIHNLENPILHKPRHFDKVVLVNTEWGAQFQHWIDRTACLLVQIRPFIKDQGWTIVGLRPRDPVLYQFWQFVKTDFNVTVEFVDNIHSYKADNLFIPCNLPWENPRKLPEVKNFLLRFILETENFEKFRNPNPKYVIYLPRKNTYNERNVVNDKQITAYLSARFGDDLKIFSHKEHTDLKELVEYFSNAKIVIGLHGGAFYNVLFSLSHPNVIEFFPKSSRKTDAIIYWISHTTGCRYWRVFIESKGKNLKVPLKRVEKVLNKALDEDYHFKDLQ
ncbi:hypothetical protein M0811_13113 [Anaeramoeba ignava]|uniref:Glycosyltransferase 61 catalytic domain-containing protein n=1 Tax=Anaeramoeba ignava TaxID=1746090 RepID=A0A9Q0R5G6_ANAIG|nr:hypothetical protein M0811_13113 [Anaeramoeba ignava]